MYSKRVERLIQALRCMPSTWPRAAHRIAFHLLERDREGAREMAEALVDACENVRHCERCRMLSDDALCGICASSSRDAALMCVVESPAEVMAIEQYTGYRGLYFVLMGRLSPLDGIGPEELGLDRFEQRLEEGEVKEVILATNPTVEGEATAHYIGELARERDIRVTRIAHGVPLGGELEYVAAGTLSHAFSGRIDFR